MSDYGLKTYDKKGNETFNTAKDTLMSESNPKDGTPKQITFVTTIVSNTGTETEGAWTVIAEYEHGYDYTPLVLVVIEEEEPNGTITQYDANSYNNTKTLVDDKKIVVMTNKANTGTKFTTTIIIMTEQTVSEGLPIEDRIYLSDINSRWIDKDTFFNTTANKSVTVIPPCSGIFECQIMSNKRYLYARTDGSNIRDITITGSISGVTNGQYKMTRLVKPGNASSQHIQAIWTGICTKGVPVILNANPSKAQNQSTTVLSTTGYIKIIPTHRGAMF